MVVDIGAFMSLIYECACEKIVGSKVGIRLFWEDHKLDIKSKVDPSRLLPC